MRLATGSIVRGRVTCEEPKSYLADPVESPARATPHGSTPVIDAHAVSDCRLQGLGIDDRAA
jgi:hypothetical protein